MDIMRPPLEQQVAPAPWLVARSKVDVPALIRKAHTEQPDASVDDIVRQLSAWGVQVSGIIVSMWVLKLREQAAEARDAKAQASAAVQQRREVESYCTCDPQPCSCGKPKPPSWWHQDCCGGRVTPAQAKARDEFFEHAAT